MTLFVTGGAGFIGANFIFYWMQQHPNDRIVCLDKLTYAGNLATLHPIMDHPHFRFVKQDICDREAIFYLFEEEHPDIVRKLNHQGLTTLGYVPVARSEKESVPVGAATPAGTR